MYNLFLPERSVIECLKYTSEIDYSELSSLTGFNKKFLQNIIIQLKKKNLIYIDSLNKTSVNLKQLENVQTGAGLKLDMIDLFSDILEDYFSKKSSIINFSVKSYWMNSFERKIFEVKVNDLKKFLNTLDAKNGPLILKQRVLVGVQACDYNALARSSMENIT